MVAIFFPKLKKNILGGEYAKRRNEKKLSTVLQQLTHHIIIVIFISAVVHTAAFGHPHLTPTAALPGRARLDRCCVHSGDGRGLTGATGWCGRSRTGNKGGCY